MAGERKAGRGASQTAATSWRFPTWLPAMSLGPWFALAIGCGYPEPADVVSDGSTIDVVAEPIRREVALIAATPNPDVDILFLVDDSPSMLGTQNNLKTAFPAFLATFNTLPTGLPNVHIGVVTSDLGTKGASDASPGPGIGSGPGACTGDGKSGNLQTYGTTLVSGTFISDIRNVDSSRSKNYSGSLADAFSAIASAGAAGCGFEQHLEAAKRAVNNNPSNAGFIRQSAGLVVVIVSDEDDCSFATSALIGNDTASLGPLQSFRCTRFGVTCDQGGLTPDAMNELGAKGMCHSNASSPYLTRIADYTTFFKGLKADPNMVMFAAIAATPSPVDVELRTPPNGGTAIPSLRHVCDVPNPVADPAVRIAEAVGAFSRATFQNVCIADQTIAVTNIARQVRTLVGDTCVPTEISIEQDCVVVEGGRTLNRCDVGTTTDCFNLVTDPACPGIQQLRLQVIRSAAPTASTASLRCR